MRLTVWMMDGSSGTVSSPVPHLTKTRSTLMYDVICGICLLTGVLEAHPSNSSVSLEGGA